ncbi:MAG: B12-binding domain-containing protein, partial [Deltaproteobacteria bacterium]|nr:B12-binding domain-containing protein [Deltaproteobacteria bacterium]
MSELLEELGREVQIGEVNRVKELISRAIDQGLTAMDILEKSLRPAMEEVGRKFETLEIYLPEMLQAADAMTAGVEILRPYLASGGGEQRKGRIILGTVQGDVHKIGKDIVRIMLEGAGFEVFDL